jgi:hypothetical protein
MISEEGEYAVISKGQNLPINPILLLSLTAQWLQDG